MTILGIFLILIGFYEIIWLIYGLVILVLGVFILFNKNEDKIEEVKTGGK